MFLVTLSIQRGLATLLLFSNIHSLISTFFFAQLDSFCTQYATLSIFNHICRKWRFLHSMGRPLIVEKQTCDKMSLAIWSIWKGTTTLLLFFESSSIHPHTFSWPNSTFLYSTCNPYKFKSHLLEVKVFTFHGSNLACWNTDLWQNVSCYLKYLKGDGHTPPFLLIFIHSFPHLPQLDFFLVNQFSITFIGREGFHIQWVDHCFLKNGPETKYTLLFEVFKGSWPHSCFSSNFFFIHSHFFLGLTQLFLYSTCNLFCL